jgi:hypothetical protein
MFLKIAASAGVVAAAAPFANIGVYAKDYKGVEEKPFGVVWKVAGKIRINDQRAKKGSAVALGDVLKTGKASQAWIILEGNAIFMMKQQSAVVVKRAIGESGQELERGADLKLDAGSVLSYVHKKDNTPYPFTVRTSTATSGVRGTTFFVEVMDGEQNYTCDCFGKVNIACLAHPEVSRDVAAVHHTSYIVANKGATADELMKPAGMIDHTDQEIFAMRNMFKAATGLDLPEEIRYVPEKDPDQDSGG